MFKVDAKGFTKQLQELTALEQNILPYAAAAALTRTAVSLRQALVGEMRTVFDRPTPYTLRAFEYQPATVAKPVAKVWLQGSAARAEGAGGGKAIPADTWMPPQIFGGLRRDKRSERQLKTKGLLPEGKYIVPGRGAKLDQYGNIKRGEVIKAMSGVRGFAYSGYDANATNSARSRRKGNAKRYFVMYKGKDPIGIAQRTGKGRSNVSMVMAFVRRPSYSKRLPFYSIGEQHIERTLPIEFEKAFAEMRKRFARGL